VSYRFSKRSYRNLQNVRPELVAVATLALDYLGRTGGPDFVVTDGARNLDEQRRLVEEGKSQTMNSRHLTGHAIDVAAFDENYNVTWDAEPYKVIAAAFQRAGEQLGIDIEWGGNWTSFVDMPHFALTREQFPTPKEFSDA
jgi:peptidoglycan L-alanyl-D-glutamate endopeptidase CwlK